jgi:hypothetical protein
VAQAVLVLYKEQPSQVHQLLCMTRASFMVVHGSCLSTPLCLSCCYAGA